MNQKNLIIGVGAVLVVAGLGYAFAFRPLAAPSPVPSTTQEQQQPPTETTPTPAEQPSLSGDTQGATIYRIASEESKAEFNLGEVLRGEPFLVVGTTTQVTGDIALNMTNPSASQVGKISINARTFKTDASNRDRMIGRFILESEKPEYELITFETTKIEGIPAEVKVGESFDVKLTGNLKIRDVVKEVTFAGRVKLENEDRLIGDASTQVMREDYKLVIPDVPFVASVDQEVILKIAFVAKKAQ
ncbi:MAG: YceI family protein [Patescibacteria group bacterium]|jgi:polyisoprenoid-binding protein YceI